MGAEDPLTIHKISAALTRVTPEVTKLPLTRQRIIKSKVKIHSSNVSVLIKEGVFFLLENMSAFLKIRVLFWPEISALEVFLNFENERMQPSKYQSDPPPPHL